MTRLNPSTHKPSIKQRKQQEGDSLDNSKIHFSKLEEKKSEINLKEQWNGEQINSKQSLLVSMFQENLFYENRSDCL